MILYTFKLFKTVDFICISSQNLTYNFIFLPFFDQNRIHPYVISNK